MIDIRADFPTLNRSIDGKPIVYLDSAATSLKPRAVIDAENLYGTTIAGNVHRGRHTLSEEASEAYEGARKRMARFVGGNPDEVVFVRNTTEAINAVASGLGLSKADVVLTTLSDHHANLVPWMRAATAVPMTPLRELDDPVGEVQKLLTSLRPRVVAVGFASNVDGHVQPVAEICRLAREHGAITVIDAAQAAPHFPLDVRALHCDFLAFSGHKMLGPTGIGVLWGAYEMLERLEPLMVGGGAVHRVHHDRYTLKGPPHRFESGTPNISGAIGLAAAADYIESLGFDRIAEHEGQLARTLFDVLSQIRGIKFLSSSGHHLAIASILPDSATVSPDHIALMLSDTYKVMTRSGFHCAHPLFDHLGSTHGALRASAYVYNTKEDIVLFGEALGSILSRLSGTP